MLFIIQLILFLGVLLVVVQVALINERVKKVDKEIVYRYIPRTFEEEQEDPVPISDIFETMFSQPTPWVGSINTYDRKKQETINNYFVTQL